MILKGAILKPLLNKPNSYQILASVLLGFAVLLLLSAPAQAESRVNGFFRANFVKSGVFDAQRRAPRLTQSQGSLVALLPVSKKRPLSKKAARESSWNQARDARSAQQLSSNEWDVSSLLSRN